MGTSLKDIQQTVKGRSLRDDAAEGDPRAGKTAEFLRLRQWTGVLVVVQDHDWEWQILVLLLVGNNKDGVGCGQQEHHDLGWPAGHGGGKYEMILKLLDKLLWNIKDCRFSCSLPFLLPGSRLFQPHTSFPQALEFFGRILKNQWTSKKKEGNLCDRFQYILEGWKD